MSNLPPGVRLSDIPGNRPEDERWDNIHDAVMNALPEGTEEVREALNKILTSNDLDEIEGACLTIVNTLQPEPNTEKMEEFVNAIEEAGRIAGEWSCPPEPEYDPEYEMEEL